MYRTSDIEGADAGFLHYQRENKSKYLAKETEEAAALRKEFGFSRVYPENLHYKTFKISQKDLLENLRNAEDPSVIIKGLYDVPSVTGRRHVKSLPKALGIIEKKMKRKEKAKKFGEKFSNEIGGDFDIGQTGMFGPDFEY